MCGYSKKHPGLLRTAKAKVQALALRVVAERLEHGEAGPDLPCGEHPTRRSSSDTATGFFVCLMISLILHCLTIEGVVFEVRIRCTDTGAQTKERLMRMMKVMLAVIVVCALGAGAAYANCGVKDTHEGTVTSVDAEKNVIVVAGEDGKEVRLTLTAESKVTDAEGNETKAADLVGKKVTVVSEHAKVDSVQQLA